MSHGASLGTAELVAFVSTADLDRGQRFYAETLGLELLERTPFAAVLRRAGSGRGRRLALSERRPDRLV